MRKYKNKAFKELTNKVVNAANELVDSTPGTLQKALENSSETEIKEGITSLYTKAANVPGVRAVGAFAAAYVARSWSCYNSPKVRRTAK